MRRPTFEVTVNLAGSISIDYDGDNNADATLDAATPGTYSFTADPLQDGTYLTSRALIHPACHQRRRRRYPAGDD